MTIYLDHLRPISEFIRTDDEDQPELILETENGLFFQGFWDPASGHFFVYRLLFEPETEEQIESIRIAELPGRLRIPAVKFQYC